MNTQLHPVMAPSETLSVRQWCELLGITRRAFSMRHILHSHEINHKKFYAFDALPLTWQLRLQSKRDAHCARNFQELLAQHNFAKRWSPPKKWESYPASARLRGEKRKAALSFYYKALDEGRTKEVAKRLAIQAWRDLFGKRCNERTIRRWTEYIDKRGGFEFAPIEAYVDGLSCAHNKARLESRLPVRLNLTEEQFEALAAEIKARSVKCEHISAVHHSLKLDWLMWREIPGLGTRQNGANFPLSKKHIRAFVASNGARRLGSHGIARFNTECAPWIHTSTATLRVHLNS